MSRYTYDTSSMYNRDNPSLNIMIEDFVEQWWGTSLGSDIKNMYENGTSYEYILERMGFNSEDFL